jgi:ribonuclease PH
MSTANSTRHDGRGSHDLRAVTVQLGTQKNPEGSVLYSCGGTKVLISASIENGVKDFLAGQNSGWITAEYAMHPRANPNRQRREGRNGSIGGRTQEIQRLVGRALRAAVDLKKLGERTITIDCDVLDADGGTRTASITGGYIALVMALDSLRKRGLVAPGVLREPTAAISISLVNNVVMSDLCYLEDSAAQVDLNLVATASGRVIEVQGTAEGEPIERKVLDQMVDLGLRNVIELTVLQESVLQGAGVDSKRLLGA